MAPDSLTSKDVLESTNAEVRRVMIERIGPSNFMNQIEAKVIDIDDHNLNGKRCLMKGSEVAFLVCACPSTSRVYHMQVDPEVKTCEEADKWLAGHSEEVPLEYVQLGRT